MPLIAQAGSVGLVQNEIYWRAEIVRTIPESADTSKHFVPCVKIHHCLFSKTHTVSVNVEGRHYLQIYDSKGAKMNEVSFTGKHYKLDIGAMAKGSYSVYVFDYQMKLLGIKPLEIK